MRFETSSTRCRATEQTHEEGDGVLRVCDAPILERWLTSEFKRLLRQFRNRSFQKDQTEGGGFEPPMSARTCRFSRPVQSAALPSFQSVDTYLLLWTLMCCHRFVSLRRTIYSEKLSNRTRLTVIASRWRDSNELFHVRQSTVSPRKVKINLGII